MRILLRARTMNVRPALAVCLLSACGPSYNGVDDGAYVNDNLGKARLLDLDRPRLAEALVGVPVAWGLRRAYDGVQWCRGVNLPTTDWRTGLPNGSVGDEKCSDVAPPPQVIGIASVSCSDDLCDAQADGTSVVITGRAAGFTTLTVTARMSSGPDITDRFHLEVLAPIRFDVRCDQKSLCPGVEGVFTGAVMRWTFEARDARQPLSSGFSVTAEPAGLVTLTRQLPVTAEGQTNFWKHYQLVAKAPGIVTLTAELGKAKWTHTFRIAEHAEATSGAVHHLAVDPGVKVDFTSERGNPPSPTFSLVGPPAGDLGMKHRLIVAWTLADGSRVLSTARDAQALASPTTFWFGPHEAGTDAFQFEFRESPCLRRPITMTGGLSGSTAVVNWSGALTCL